MNKYIMEASDAAAAPASKDGINEKTMALAMAYVRRQDWGEQYGEAEALSRGTIFPALDFPFEGTGGGARR